MFRDRLCRALYVKAEKYFLGRKAVIGGEIVKFDPPVFLPTPGCQPSTPSLSTRSNHPGTLVNMTNRRPDARVSTGIPPDLGGHLTYSHIGIYCTYATSRDYIGCLQCGR